MSPVKDQITVREQSTKKGGSISKFLRGGHLEEEGFNSEGGNEGEEPIDEESELELYQLSEGS